MQQFSVLQVYSLWWLFVDPLVVADIKIQQFQHEQKPFDSWLYITQSQQTRPNTIASSSRKQFYLFHSSIKCKLLSATIWVACKIFSKLSIYLNFEYFVIITIVFSYFHVLNMSLGVMHISKSKTNYMNNNDTANTLWILN